MSHTDWNQGSTDQARTNKIFGKADRADAVRRQGDSRESPKNTFKDHFTAIWWSYIGKRDMGFN